MRTKAKTSQAGTLYLVHVLTHSTRAHLDSKLAQFGISSFQYTILTVIERNENVSSARLSRRFHVTPQAMGEVVLFLDKKGLIRRSEDVKNRKILHLNLTEAGAELLRSAEDIVADFERTVFAASTAPELETLRAQLLMTLATLRDTAATKRRAPAPLS